MLIENFFCFTLVLFMTDGAGADPKVRLRLKLLAPPPPLKYHLRKTILNVKYTVIPLDLSDKTSLQIINGLRSYLVGLTSQQPLVRIFE